MSKLLLLCALITLGLANVAEADSFRCPNGGIVSSGDNQSIVAMKCDTPTYKLSRIETESGYKGATIVINVEEWTYNEGPDRLVHILTFRNGVLFSIQTAGFGK
jgi:hypothetical protein